jgi:hypothetical protein
MIMRVWIVRGGVILLGVALLVTLLVALSGSGHNPNHDINLEQAKEAANRVHPQPKPGFKYVPGAGG